MKNMMMTLSLLSVLAFNAQAQDDPAPGERIEITFTSGGTIMGKVVAPPPGAPAASLTLDVALEYPGVTGTLTVPKRDIQSIRKLRIVKDTRPSDRTNPPSVQDRPNPAPAKPVVVPPETAPAPTPADDEAAKKAEEEQRKAKEIYAKFPAPDWSPERRQTIRLKRARGQLPTPAEREFEQGYDLWTKGRDAANQK